MRTDTNNLQVARWNDDPTQRGECLDKLIPKIKTESKRQGRRYGVEFYQVDIASDMQVSLLQQMREAHPDGPFAEESPKEAADVLLGGFGICEQAKLHARKERRKQSRQAEIFEDLLPAPDVPPDMEKQLMDVVQLIQRIISLMRNFTARDRQSFLYWSLRVTGVYDLPEPNFVQALKAAGVSVPDARAYKENYEKHRGRNSSDRKAISRACAKVEETFTNRANLMSLLAIVFAFVLSLASYNALQQGRSIHQNDFVNQRSFIHHIALAHQENLTDGNALAHQENLIDQITFAHQGNLRIRTHSLYKSPQSFKSPFARSLTERIASRNFSLRNAVFT